MCTVVSEWNVFQWFPYRGFSRGPCWRAETMKQFCMKIDHISQRRENVLFLPSNMAVMTSHENALLSECVWPLDLWFARTCGAEIRVQSQNQTERTTEIVRKRKAHIKETKYIIPLRNIWLRTEREMFCSFAWLVLGDKASLSVAVRFASSLVSLRFAARFMSLERLHAGYDKASWFVLLP